MPQWRKLHTKVTESLDFNDIPDYFSRCLWLLLPLKLCREGRGLDSPAWVRSQYFPLDENVTLEQCAAALDCFAEMGMIVRYSVNGRNYFHIPGESWTYHQGNTEKEADSIYPEPPEPVKTDTRPTPEPVQTYSRPTPDLLQTNSGTDSDSDADPEEIQMQCAVPNGTGAVQPALLEQNTPEKAKTQGKKRPKRDPPPPAVETFRAATERFPKKTLWPGIVEIVGDDPANLERWKRVVLAWVAMGWNPINVKGMLQHFAEGKIPGDDNNRARASPGQKPNEPRFYDGIRKWAEKEGLTWPQPTQSAE